MDFARPERCSETANIRQVRAGYAIVHAVDVQHIEVACLGAADQEKIGFLQGRTPDEAEYGMPILASRQATPRAVASRPVANDLVIDSVTGWS